MREEARDLWEQATADLESARVNLDVGKYYVSAFLSHQAVEKGLKALYICQKARYYPRTHKVHVLGEAVGIPEEYLPNLLDLTPVFVNTRYPDAANGVPARIYHKKKAEELLSKASEVMKWIETQLK